MKIRRVQRVMVQKGFDIEVDGILGPNTRHVLMEFQRQQGFAATGQIDNRTVTALGLSNLRGQGAGRAAGAKEPSTTGQGSGKMQQPSANKGAGGANDAEPVRPRSARRKWQ